MISLFKRILSKCRIKSMPKLEKIFLICMIPIGIAYLISVIPNYVYDENISIERAYDLSSGNLRPKINSEGNASISVPRQYAENNMVINNSYKTLGEVLKERTNYNDNVELNIAANSIKNFVIPYIPTSFVFLIAKIINLNFFLAIYIARLLNFIIFLICGYYAIKIIPFGKLILFVYLLIPMVIHQAISLSIESIMNTILIFFIAYSLYLFKTKVEITRTKKIVYYLLCFFIASQAILYSPLVLLSLLIINRKDIKDKRRILISVFLIVLLGIFSNYLMLNKYKDNGNISTYYNTDKEKQLEFIVEEPISFLQTIGNTLEQKSYILIEYFIGANIGHTIVDVNKMLILLYMILLVVSIFYNEEKVVLNSKEKLLFVAIFVFVIVNIFTSLYLNSTPVASNIIEGIHGKALIPLIILLLLCLKTRNKNIELKEFILFFILAIYLVNISFILEIVKYFFS